MKNEGNNVYSVFDEIISREEKESFLTQKARVVWMTGLSGSGKTTLARYLERKLQDNGFFTKLLDGDNVRSGLNKGLSFSESDRNENIRRIAEVSKLFLDGGVICINCFVSPTAEIRQLAKDIIGEADFLEVYVNTPLEECEKRDVKGLYAKARKGEIKDFTGISAPFEAPENPTIEVLTAGKTIEEAGDDFYNKLIPFITKEKQ
ncbi:MAG: adenylyl-sulfate kinase [Salibacteraceae bacterium]|jgi:adenylylsulfate kinase|nr:adenylyl-sulfate kinase [Salibacteraceae bacterium]MDP4687735.1 adenylyl-sulfate kinase [Salibacteraceae bacterium]MDP4762351.1 adenylyl-sulfate kinase [Salibacteraceae bacterium]MDP4845099.1 adenylyl-sulfate kinase [Salibacteraceae bacterium]MDP4934235.1 adenylyl-sulfate kinase [Salibacteraceae bacterium]